MGAGVGSAGTGDELRQLKDPATHTELHQCHTAKPLRVCQCIACRDTPRYTRLSDPHLYLRVIQSCAPGPKMLDPSIYRCSDQKPPVCLKHDTTSPVQVSADDETDLHLRPPPHTTRTLGLQLSDCIPSQRSNVYCRQPYCSS